MSTEHDSTYVPILAYPPNYHHSANPNPNAANSNQYGHYSNVNYRNPPVTNGYPANHHGNYNYAHDGNGNNPYVQVTVVPASSSAPGKSPMDKIHDAFNRCGKKFEHATKKVESLADNVWNHLRTSPHITDAAMARLAQGTKVLTEGGQEKLFQHTFEMLPGEKFLKAYACYLSTASGPVIGMLYLSTKKLAFCSDNPLCYYSSTGQQEWMYYKVVLLLDELSAVNPSANRLNPSDKYIQVVTRDGHEFWFMGFISYDKALKKIRELLQGSSTCGST